MQKHFIPQRIKEVKKSYLDFELKHIKEEQVKAIALAFRDKKKLENHSNSAILYCLGLSDNYTDARRCEYHVSGSGPDIDTDFSPSGRDQLIKALQKKYGKEHVARICTYKPWSLKDSVVDFTKVTQMKKGYSPFSENSKNQLLFNEEGEPIYGSYSQGEAISNQVPDSYRGRHTKWKDLKDDEFFDDLISKNSTIFNKAGAMDGEPRNSSIHACGVLISPEPLRNQIPLRTVEKDSKGNVINWFFVTQWEGPQLEKLGFTKYDILVIENLDIMKMTLDLIGKNWSWLEREVPYDDQKVFDFINAGYVAGLFQIEEGHVMQVIQKVKPKTVHDIAIISALIRPGPRDAGLTNDYIKYRQSGQTQNKLHPLLDDVLEETGGVLVYQEQVLKALEILGGMDLATADQVRRAMGKKKKDLMEKYHKIFVQGCKDKHEIQNNVAQGIWSSIETFADYGFNKAHALAYAYITYLNAYLKTHHPTEYMLSLLTKRISKPDKFQKYIQEARLMGIDIRPPDVSHSGLGFSRAGESAVVFGLNALHGVGETATEKILEARGDVPFKNLMDFFERVDRSKVNSKVMTILAKSGAFSSFNMNREKLVEALPDIQKYLKDKEAYYSSIVRKEQRDIEIAAWQIEFDAWSALKKEGKVTKLDEPYEDEELGRKVHWSPPRPKKPVKVKIRQEPVLLDLESLKQETKAITLPMVVWEAEYCKFFISAHPLDFVNIPATVKYNLIEDIDGITHLKGRLLAAIVSIDERKIKSGRNRGKKMAVLTIEDKTGLANISVFASQYSQQVFQDLQVGDVIYLPYKFSRITGNTLELQVAGKLRVV